MPKEKQSDNEAQEAAVAPITCAEAGRRGGKALVEKRGSDHFKKIGRKGGQRTLARHGEDHYSQLGVKGGEATREKYEGTDYYREIARSRRRDARALGEGAVAPEEARADGGSTREGWVDV